MKESTEGRLKREGKIPLCDLCSLSSQSSLGNLAKFSPDSFYVKFKLLQIKF